jgi:hypothetical protein
VTLRISLFLRHPPFCNRATTTGCKS